MCLKQYKLVDLYSMSSGLSSKPSQAGHGAPFISFSTIFNNPILPDEIVEKMDTTLAEQIKYSIKKGDVLITRTSETLDELAMTSAALKDYLNVTFSGFAKRLRPTKENIENKITYDRYMAFFFRSEYFRKIINNMATMTLRASFNEQILSYINVYLPKYEYQVKVGDMLFIIHQQIERNNAMVKKLQVLSQTIFNYYYSNNSKKTVKLKTIAKMYQPETITGSDFIENGKYLVYGSGGIIGRYDKYNHTDSELMISCRGLCGNISLSLPYSWIIGNQMIIKPNDSKLKYYLYNYLQIMNLKKVETGSVQKQITRANLENLDIELPNENILSSIANRLELIHNELIKVIKLNEKLNSLKNTLLPLLINQQLT